MFTPSTCRPHVSKKATFFDMAAESFSRARDTWFEGSLTSPAFSSGTVKSPANVFVVAANCCVLVAGLNPTGPFFGRSPLNYAARSR